MLFNFESLLKILAHIAKDKVSASEEIDVFDSIVGELEDVGKLKLNYLKVHF